MTFQQAFQQAVLMSCPDAIPGAAAPAAPIALPDERQFSFTTRYRKSHATLAWTIDDYAIRDANEESLEVEFSVGDAADETRWKLQCFFGSCYDDHKGEIISLISYPQKFLLRLGARCVSIKISLNVIACHLRK